MLKLIHQTLTKHLQEYRLKARRLVAFSMPFFHLSFSPSNFFHHRLLAPMLPVETGKSYSFLRAEAAPLQHTCLGEKSKYTLDLNILAQ